MFLQAYSAGYLEGYVTSELLFMQWQNTVEGYCDWIGENVCKKISDYLEVNTLWVKRKIRQHRRFKNLYHEKSNKYSSTLYDNATMRNGNPYWHHVSLFYDQLQGLEDGYDAKIKATQMVNESLNPIKLYQGGTHFPTLKNNHYNDL